MKYQKMYNMLEHADFIDINNDRMKILGIRTDEDGHWSLHLDHPQFIEADDSGYISDEVLADAIRNGSVKVWRLNIVEPIGGWLDD